MNNTDLIHLIKHFMRNEHKAVEEVIDSPLSEVANLIKVLQSCQGKVVFIGVGKSGIIARKLAATFASTGTPSFFVHGTEAVHGDLGMVAKDDVVILISNSGETAEILATLPSLKKMGNYLISFTRSHHSSLAISCDLSVEIPVKSEADKLLPGVRIISRFGTGIDNIDLRAAQQSGIVVNNAVGINSNAVAEFIIGLIFASMRNIPGSYHAMQNGYWGESHGCELQGKRIGLVGYGNIGKTLAKRLSGFDVELLAFDKQPDYQFADKAGVQFVSIEDIFMQSHVIIVLLPFSSELENFISHKYLSMMRNGALIINAARGKLLDEGALLQVIEERNVFAALDVFSSEPLAQFSPLLHAKNIITTPHIAAATVESYQQTGIHVAQSIIDYFAGREIKNVL